MHVVIRQNQQWDKVRSDVHPSFVRENVSQLEYRSFDLDDSFEAGNEFRFVDFRSLNSPGQNTQRIDKSHKPYQLMVAMDSPRGSEAYSQYPDMNGNFIIDNFDYRQEPWVSTNYLYVNFTLRSKQLNSNVYVTGAFNSWARNEENKMTYKDGLYVSQLLLKQGLYNYRYEADTKDESERKYMEGSHFQTENVYEVMAYYHPFQPNADLLIGYFLIPVNVR